MRKSTATKKCRHAATIGLAVGLILLVPPETWGGIPKAMRTEAVYPDTLVLSGTATQDAEYRGGVILSTQVIESGNVTYMAEKEIVLNPGFEIREGAGFGTIMERDSIHQVRMLTYNLWIQQKDYTGHIKLLRDIRPDVVSVQEVLGKDNFQKLKVDGLDGAACYTMKREGKDYGIGMLWRSETVGVPLRRATGKVTIQKSKDDSDDHRAFIVAEFKDFCFVATHYSLDEKYRKEMGQMILNHYIVKDCQTANKPVYVAGDMNEGRIFDVNCKHTAHSGAGIGKLKDAGFEVLNDTTTCSHATYYKKENGEVVEKRYIDLILEWNPHPAPYYKRMDRGIPIPEGERDKWLNTDEVSDHYPYSVRIKVK